MRRTTISHFSFLIRSELSLTINGQYARGLTIVPIPIKNPNPSSRKVRIIWCRRRDLNPHDVAIARF